MGNKKKKKSYKKCEKMFRKSERKRLKRERKRTMASKLHQEDPDDDYFLANLFNSQVDVTDQKDGGKIADLQTYPTAADRRRSRMRKEKKEKHKKTRDENLSKMRKIEFLNSDSEDDKNLFGDASDGHAVDEIIKKNEDNEMKIPTKTARRIRKTVNKLSDVLDNCLNLQ